MSLHRKIILGRLAKIYKGTTPTTCKDAVPDINRAPIENGVDEQNGGKNA